MIQDMSTIYGFKKPVTRDQHGSSLTLAPLMSKQRSRLGAGKSIPIVQGDNSHVLYPLKKEHMFVGLRS